MKETKFFILIMIFITILGCTTGCMMSVGMETTDDKECYKFVDYKETEHIVSGNKWMCWRSDTFFYCENEDTYIQVREYGRIKCPESEGEV